MDYTGKTAIVTGASKGIGKAIAAMLSEKGCRVIGTNTDGRNGDLDIEMKTLDLQSSSSISTFCRNIGQSNTVDILVNNAGINIIESIETISFENWDKVISTNLTGPMKLVNGLLPSMKQSKSGRIVNLSSIWGVIAKEKRNAYAAAKTGLIGLTRTLALDLAKYGILVNAVCPGFTLTELTRRSLSDEEMNALKSQIPLKRMAETNEIANAVCFLSSELNTYITGQALIIDGGFTIV